MFHLLIFYNQFKNKKGILHVQAQQHISLTYQPWGTGKKPLWLSLLVTVLLFTMRCRGFHREKAGILECGGTSLEGQARSCHSLSGEP